jgi:hypothetical protein
MFHRNETIVEDAMKLPEGPRSPRGTTIGGVSKKKGIKGRGAGSLAKESKFSQDQPDPFTQPPLNSIPIGNKTKRPRGTNPPKQPRTRNRMATGKGGKTPGDSSAIGRL